jgi:hypothetical protein
VVLWHCLCLRSSWVVRSNPVVVYGGSFHNSSACWQHKSWFKSQLITQINNVLRLNRQSF